MGDYKRDRSRVDKALRKSGIVVVMNKDHVKKPEHLAITMWEVYQAGYVAECTFRIEEGLIREGMAELVKKREESTADNPFVLGVGSIINPKELFSAMELGFDMIVAPANVMSGYAEPKEFVRITREADIFSSPAIFTPAELQYFIEREDGLEPDAIKIFPARSHGPLGLSDLLAPYVRDRHKDRIIMPTGAVNFESGPEYIKVISKRGYTPVLGMSAPLSLVGKREKPGDVDTIRESLSEFQRKFDEALGA